MLLEQQLLVFPPSMSYIRAIVSTTSVHHFRYTRSVKAASGARMMMGTQRTMVSVILIFPYCV